MMCALCRVPIHLLKSLFLLASGADPNILSGNICQELESKEGKRVEPEPKINNIGSAALL